MALSQTFRKKIVADYRTHEKDSGSPEVQIALLTEDIKVLTEHMKLHRKDYHSRQGLLKKVGRRNKLMAYLQRTAYPRYAAICERLQLRR
jgi:small subunit ribosomal protein S15